MGLARLIYRTSLALYGQAVKLAGQRNEKARLWLEGRKGLLDRLRKEWQPGESPVLWMHVASLGEFEQGRPLLEKIRSEKPDWKIFLTFFSPSGYEVRKNYAGADAVYYLPLDSPSNAEQFLDLVRPTMAVFVKYEFWYYYFMACRERRIPLFMLSALFRPSQVFFKPYGQLHRSMLDAVTHFFVQDKDSANLLANLGFQNTSVIPDTRVDRVAGIASTALQIPTIEQFLGKGKAFIGGSVYDKENELIHEAWKAGLIRDKIILAPHKTDAAHVEAIRAVWGDNAVLYTDSAGKDLSDKQVLIVNTVGMLSSLYRYGRIAFIGGGFGRSIHNTLEPAAFGLPILFGPNYKKFQEAHILLHTGGARCVKDVEETLTALKEWQNENALDHASAASKAYITDNTGGTEMVYKWLEKKGYLGS